MSLFDAGSLSGFNLHNQLVAILSAVVIPLERRYSVKADKAQYKT
jgi:hypothetical protein